jgi:hypothetical protein
MDRDILQHLRPQYLRLPRSRREKLMCAMIRINYGTSWPGDEEVTRFFLPTSLRDRLHLNGLTSIIEALCPISDEPTLVGFVAEADDSELSPGNQAYREDVKVALQVLDKAKFH